MAGVKGMKGSGGSRPGAGRKPKEKTVAEQPPMHGDTDMLSLLQDVALGRVDATPLQVRAAIAAVQYTHTKKSDGGKKEEAQERAEQAASKFRRSAPPKLVASGGQKV